MERADEFAYLDATAQAELVRRKEVSPAALVEAAIGRIERLNPALNTVITPTYELARRAAAGPLPEGPFTGVPFLLKDLCAEYAGVRHAEGSSFLRDFVPDRDSELVVRYKRAGLIVVGKTNTPELGLLPTTEPRRFGATRNPWNPERTPGGSSGGSAAAVAAGLVPMAHGNDGGGSIRIPASCCGVFGLKPTRARNPLGPFYGDIFAGLVAEHALTRSVRDSAALLDATCGPDVGDPYWAPPPARPFVQEVGLEPGRLRIAFSLQPLGGGDVSSDCIAAVEDAAALCAGIGHEVEEAAPPVDGRALGRAFGDMWAAGTAWNVDYWVRRTGRAADPEQFEPLTWAYQMRGRRVDGAAFLSAQEEAQRISRAIARFFLEYDIWLTR